MDNPNNPEFSALRQEQIAAIIARNHRQFLADLQLPIPDDEPFISPAGLAYLIPRPIYELANFPSLVSIRQSDFENPHIISFSIAEDRQKPISNPKSLEQYWEDQVSYWQKLAQYNHGKSSIQPAPISIPPDVDYFHAELENELDNNSISLSDFVFLHLTLEKINQHELFVSVYQDRPEFRHQGIALAFYHQLRELGLKLGFSYITGENDPHNLTFFVDKLGRKKFLDLTQDQQNLFLDNHNSGFDPTYFTVDFL